MMRPITPGKHPRNSVQSQVSSGFPSPAEDYEEAPLDLHNLVVVNPPATYFMRVETSQMQRFGIERDDIIAVDRSLMPTKSCLVVAVIDDTFVVKQCAADDDALILTDAEGEEKSELGAIWGVVTYIVRKV